MYQLLTYADDAGTARSALAVDGAAYDILRAADALGKTLPGYAAIDIVSDWQNAHGLMDALADAAAGGKLAGAALGATTDLTLKAPLLYPHTLFMAGSNYGAHTNEMAGNEFDKTKRRPYFFAKLPRQCVIGSGEAIRLPHTAKQVDWEIELAAVIGTPARNVKAKDALKHICGYTILHDVSARDIGNRDDWPQWRRDWLMHKSFDTAAPMGPVVVPAEFIPDPHNLFLKTWINDELMQDSNTDDMTFNLNEQIEFLSEFFTLMPGDVISTGTPSGVGRPRGIFLKPGDTVRMEIEKIGTLINPVVAGD
ncbi:MAG: 2-keto-4-pentenoate hydratase/2-oxohepta-3-ene-1,7-dioic acid hydratase in catechol pathway [Alphaproteobacteria bacterium]|jgi:2-keto-4-pentenoate hydratase/2-oxohepta-3-ene-1,7-dioic acid hydratase in catechol pathway